MLIMRDERTTAKNIEARVMAVLRLLRHKFLHASLKNIRMHFALPSYLNPFIFGMI
jgi:hypothetical protein